MIIIINNTPIGYRRTLKKMASQEGSLWIPPLNNSKSSMPKNIPNIIPDNNAEKTVI